MSIESKPGNLLLGLRRVRPEVAGCADEAFAAIDFMLKHILEELLEKYAEHGTTQFAIPEILKVPPISVISTCT